VTDGAIPYEPAETTAMVLETEREACANLRAVLKLVTRGKLRCSASSQRPSEITVRMVEEVLVNGDYYRAGEAIAAFAWPLLLQAGGLALLERTSMRLTARGRALLDVPPDEDGPVRAALAGLWTRWLTKAPIDELMRIEAIRGQRVPATLTAPTKRRAAVAAGLADLPVGRWVPADEMLRLIRKQDPPLVVARSPAAVGRLFIGSPDRGGLDQPGAGAWEILEGRYALCVAFEYAATLGLLDVAYNAPDNARDDFRANRGARRYDYLSRYDGLTAVRLTASGAAVLQGSGEADGAEPVAAEPDAAEPDAAGPDAAVDGPSSDG
jgi:hypothetical protein